MAKQSVTAVNSVGVCFSKILPQCLRILQDFGKNWKNGGRGTDIYRGWYGENSRV